jgi:hypothetical protein
MLTTKTSGGRQGICLSPCATGNPSRGLGRFDIVQPVPMAAGDEEIAALSIKIGHRVSFHAFYALQHNAKPMLQCSNR